MTDELDDLHAALKAATPAPDAARRAENLALAQKNYDALQGSPGAARPKDDRHPAGWFISGGRRMFHALTSRGGLAATTAIVAIALVVATPQGRSLFSLPPLAGTPGGLGKPDRERAPVSRPDATRRDDAPNRAAPADGMAQNQPPAPGRDLPAIAPKTAPSAQALGGLGPSMLPPPQAAPSPISPQSSGTGSNAPGALGAMAVEAVPRGAARRAQAPRMAASRPLAERLPPDAFESDSESFANADASPVRITAEDPVSTFSIDVDTASYAVVRSSLMAGRLPPRDAVRVEEMVNYFPYDYPAPGAGDAPFRPTVTVMQTPWNPGTELVHIALQGRMPALDDRPPLNLVFLIDTSGSMRDANKLPLLKQSFRLLLGQLRPQDKVAIVTYAGNAGQVLEPTPASERARILSALERLEAGGSTAGQAGLQQAYRVAGAMAGDGDVTRVILATDGDFNVGIDDPEALKTYISRQREGGVYLSVLGFGRGNLDDATMQALAQNGNGTAAYIDTLNEAQKVLVDQLSGALFPIADDVKVQVEFNPATVAEYRLIGYETRALRREDFNNDKVDAGEIGAGHSVTAIYEITPVGSDAVLNDPLRYGAAPAAGGPDGEIGFLRLRYKAPGSATSKLIEMPIRQGAREAGTEARFGAAIAGFGQLLRGSAYLGDWSWGDAIALASGALGADAFGYRREAVSLMRLAESLSQR